MSDFDNQLRRALSADDEAFLKDLENGEGMFTQLTATLHGPQRFWVIYAILISLPIFGAAMYSLYRMFMTDNIKHVILWGALLGFGMLAVGMIKLWLLSRASHLSVLRELKRIELRLVQLAESR